MHHLAERMHAGIGSAGTRGDQCALTEFVQRLLQSVLYRLPMGLGLPALPRRTVVLKAECDASQEVSSVVARGGPAARDSTPIAITGSARVERVRGRARSQPRSVTRARRHGHQSPGKPRQARAWCLTLSYSPHSVSSARAWLAYRRLLTLRDQASARSA